MRECANGVRARWGGPQSARAGAYYLALTADMDESGDGRLSAGDGWLAAVRLPARFATHPIAP